MTLSIVGEQFAPEDDIWADQAFVDAYSRKCSPGVARCRARGGRHLYPDLPLTDIDFHHVRPWDGLLVRYETCGSCECAYQEQLWQAFEVVNGRGETEPRITYLVAFTRYRPHPVTGEEYPIKGHGRVKPAMFREALASTRMTKKTKQWAQDALIQMRKTERER